MEGSPQPDDPAAAYEHLRRQGRMYWDADIEAWIVTGYRETQEVLTDRSLSSGWLRGPMFGHLRTPAIDHVREWLMWLDPPQHEGVRSLLAPLFTARAVQTWARAVHERVAGGYAEFVAKGGGDVVADFALPVVTDVIARFTGLAPVDRRTLREWSTAASSLMATPHRRRTAVQADRSLAQLAGEVAGLAGPTGTVMGRAGPGGHPGAGPVHLASLFTFAGIETTAQAVIRLVDLHGDRVFAPDRPAEQLVAELLRYDTPVPQVPRVAVDRTRIAGHHLAAGQSVMVLLAAANHDPLVFGDAAPVSPRDDASRHLAYGYGRHRCIGAPLANLILRSVAGELRRYPAPERVHPTDWHRGRGYRGVARLEVSYDPTGGV